MGHPDVASVDGLDIIELEVEAGARTPAFVSAKLLPGRALMLLQARARVADGRDIEVLWAPAPAAAARVLDGGPDDFVGNASFSFGAAILAPYANRIRGRYSPTDRSIETDIGGRRLRLPANCGGKAPGAEKYAIHGLILARPVEEIEVDRKAELAQAAGLIRAEDFGVGWPSSTDLHIRWVLRPDALSLQVTARNVGDEDVPIGIGWHPYFALPSGRREQARMRVPARSHVVVNDYDEVLPTGEIRPVQGTRFDFRAPQGAPLGEAYLDDCFVDIDKTAAGETVCEVFDPPSRHALRVRASSPEVSAIQTFTRPDRPFVVIEPQFNWADPFGAEWGAAHDTGMVLLKPQHSIDYRVQLELFTSA